VVRPRAVRKETEEVVTGVAYVPPPGYYNFWPYWQAAYRDVYVTSSYLKENTIVRAEFNLYNTKDEKRCGTARATLFTRKTSGSWAKATPRCLSTN
jgi:hypothetical protein